MIKQFDEAQESLRGVKEHHNELYTQLKAKNAERKEGHRLTKAARGRADEERADSKAKQQHANKLAGGALMWASGNLFGRLGRSVASPFFAPPRQAPAASGGRPRRGRSRCRRRKLPRHSWLSSAQAAES